MQSKKEQLYALDIFIYNKIKFFSENKNGNGYCNMLNKTFAEETNRKPVSISRSISKLLKLGYIENIGNKQFRRLRITDKKFTYDKFVNNLDNIVNNLDNIVNNLDKGLIGLINNLDKPKLTILINLINNLDKQRIMNIIMNNNNEIINKEEAAQKTEKPTKVLDPFFSEEVTEFFQLVKEYANNQYNDFKPNRLLVAEMLPKISLDMEIWKQVLKRSRSMGHKINGEFKPLSLKNMFEHYSEILDGTYGLVNKWE